MVIQNEYCTIYLLTNKINGKIYIGQTWLPLQQRMQKDGAGYKNSIYLYNAIQKYGSENFEYTILEQCIDQEIADKCEVNYINKYNSLDHNIGYNIKEGGSVGKHSEETKNKISQTLINNYCTMTSEEKAARSAAISTYWLGKMRGPHTEEWKINNSKMMKKRHVIMGHPMKGKSHTESAKLKISQASKGIKRDPESVKIGALKRRIDKDKEKLIIYLYINNINIKDIAKQCQVGLGTIYRTLDRNNIARTNNFGKWKGKAHSSETKEKMSKMRQKYWDSKR